MNDLRSNNPSPKREDWMNPLNRIIWSKAFRKKETSVTIRDGRKFILDYDVPPFVIKTLGDKVDAVHVRMAPMSEQPTWVEQNFAPFGFFDLREVRNMLWITSGNKDTSASAIHEKLPKIATDVKT